MQTRGSTFTATLSQKINMCIAIGHIPQKHNPKYWLWLTCWAVLCSFAITTRILFSFTVCLIICLNSAGLSVRHHDQMAHVFMHTSRTQQTSEMVKHTHLFWYTGTWSMTLARHAASAMQTLSAYRVTSMKRTCFQEVLESKGNIQQPIGSRGSACHIAFRISLHPSSTSELRHPHLKKVQCEYQSQQISQLRLPTSTIT